MKNILRVTIVLMLLASTASTAFNKKSSVTGFGGPVPSPCPVACEPPKN